MRCTTRLLERSRLGVLAVAIGLMAAAALASCSSSSDEVESEDPADAAAADGSSLSEAAVVETGPPGPDAALFDGGPLPIDCAAPSCAVALVTTRGASASDPAEGFCALLRDGTVACWGAGKAGQLGRAADAGLADSARAERVSGLGGVVSLDHTCAVDGTGAVFCWGTGPFLRSPTEATSTEPLPVKLEIPSATRVAIGDVAGCALVDGGVVCWGSNRHGQIAPFDSAPSSAVLSARAVAVPGGPPLRDVVVGNASFALRTDGKVASWGANPPLARVSSLFPDPHPLRTVLSGIMSLDVDDDVACATAGGVGYCWGALASGTEEPSRPPRLERALPGRVAAPEPLVQIATARIRVGPSGAASVDPQRWCACAGSGAVYCWGENAGGQAGDGTKAYAHEAVKVVGLPRPAAQVKTTSGATCALLTNGTVHCWGTNLYGQLGNGKITVPSLTPQEVVLP